MALGADPVNGSAVVDQVLNCIDEKILMYLIDASGGNEVVVIQIQLRVRIHLPCFFEPVHHDFVTQNIHDIVIPVILIDDVPVDKQSCQFACLIFDVIHHAVTQIVRIVLIGFEVIRCIVPGGPDQTMSPDFNISVSQPVKRIEQHAPIPGFPGSPFEIVFHDHTVEIILDDGIVHVSVRTAAHDAAGHHSRSKIVKMFSHAQLDRRILHRITVFIFHSDFNLTLAVGVDFLFGLHAPGGIRFHPGIGNGSAGHVPERQDILIIEKFEPADLNDLRFITQAEFDCCLSGLVIIHTLKRHKKLSPLTDDYEGV